MRFKTLMTVKAIVCFILGIILLVIPGPSFSLMGVALAAGGIFAVREYGTSLLGIFVLTSIGRSVQKSKAREAIILALVLFDGIGFVLSLIAVLAGTLNAWGWIIAFIYLFFALGFGYYLYQEKRKIRG